MFWNIAKLSMTILWNLRFLYRVDTTLKIEFTEVIFEKNFKMFVLTKRNSCRDYPTEHFLLNSCYIFMNILVIKKKKERNLTLNYIIYCLLNTLLIKYINTHLHAEMYKHSESETISFLLQLIRIQTYTLGSKFGCMCRQWNMHTHTPTHAHTHRKLVGRCVQACTSTHLYSLWYCRLVGACSLSPAPVGCCGSLVLLQLPCIPMWFVWHSRN